MVNDTLIISNSKIERRWHWNKGNSVPVSLKNMSTGKVLPFDDKLPGFNLVGKKFLKSTDFKIEPVIKSMYGAAHLAVSFIGNYDGVDLKRVFQIYPHLPTISITIGVSKNKEESLFALRQYMKESISYDAKYHEMIMMNTWGDRGQDGKINEKFILRELEAGAKLGITHFQIDDGWQQGLSSNSASTAGKL